MDGKQHAFFGLATSAALAAGLQDTGTMMEIGTVATILCGTVGSVLPDIDTPTSGIGYRFPHLAKFLYNHFGHRGVTHDAGIAGALLVLFIATGLPVPAHIMIGILGHILLDSFTQAGVPKPFFSIKNRKIIRNYFDDPKNDIAKKEYYDSNMMVWKNKKLQILRNFHITTTAIMSLMISTAILLILSMIPGSHGMQDAVNIANTAIDFVKTSL